MSSAVKFWVGNTDYLMPSGSKTVKTNKMPSLFQLSWMGCLTESNANSTSNLCIYIGHADTDQAKYLIANLDILRGSVTESILSKMNCSKKKSIATINLKSLLRQNTMQILQVTTTRKAIRFIYHNLCVNNLFERKNRPTLMFNRLITQLSNTTCA